MFVIWIYLFPQEPDERAKMGMFILAVLIDCQIHLLFFIALPTPPKKVFKIVFAKIDVTSFYFL